MKLLILIFSLFTSVPLVSAHNAAIKGHKDIKSTYISSCNNKNYGYHKQNNNNHWHEVKFKDGEWTIIDDKKTYSSDPCLNKDKIKASLVRCVDGDTALLNVEGKEKKYRFLAVDTPESVHPTKEVQVYAKEASKNTCDLLTNASSILVEYDSNSDKEDKYGRELAWIWVDDILLQELMISEGYARVSYVYSDYKYINKLCSLEKNAREENKGIWQYGYESGYCTTINNTGTNNSTNNVYTVTFEDLDNITEVVVAKGMKVKKIEEKGRFGFYFDGWYRDNKKYNFNNPITSNITLKAKYKIDYMYVAIIIVIIITSTLSRVKESKKYGKNNKKSFK